MRNLRQVEQLFSSRAKAQLARVLCRPAVGRTIASLKHDRLPSGPDLVPTDSAFISPVTKAKIFWGSCESGEIRMAER